MERPYLRVQTGYGEELPETHPAWVAPGSTRIESSARKSRRRIVTSYRAVDDE